MNKLKKINSFINSNKIKEKNKVVFLTAPSDCFCVYFYNGLNSEPFIDRVLGFKIIYDYNNPDYIQSIPIIFEEQHLKFLNNCIIDLISDKEHCIKTYKIYRGKK